MAVVRELWSDDRLDVLNGRIDEGFANVGRRFERIDERLNEKFLAVRAEMKAGFERVDDKFEKLNRILVYGVVSISGAIVAGMAATIGLVATQL
jgi:hypothetical protein